jgi:uncharacterized membrane protein YgaE (UPF0421/DUF939 family)
MITLLAMQSGLRESFEISLKQFAGTALGCVAAAVLATHYGSNGAIYGGALLGIGILCSLIGMDRAAYRFAGTTSTIVMLIPRSAPAWVTGIHRFVEVSVGIAVALFVTAVWKERAVAE